MELSQELGLPKKFPTWLAQFHRCRWKSIPLNEATKQLIVVQRQSCQAAENDLHRKVQSERSQEAIQKAIDNSERGLKKARESIRKARGSEKGGKPTDKPTPGRKGR